MHNSLSKNHQKCAFHRFYWLFIELTVELRIIQGF